MSGIVGYGAYVPYWRIERSDIATTLGGRRGKGQRAVAGYDEDTTTMGVEAARLALRSLDEPTPESLFFATTEPAYLDKTNANAVHAALDLDRAVPAFDVVGSARSAAAAVLAADRLGGLAVVSDMRNGPAGSTDEAGGGDGAAAFLFGDVMPVVELVGTGHTTHEFMERWRLPAETASRRADERFVETVYSRLTDDAVAAALKAADISNADVNHVIVSSANERIGRFAARSFDGSVQAPDLSAEIGHCGAAHWPLLLAGVLDQAGSDEHIAVVSMADGVTVMVFRTTSRLRAYRDERAERDIATLDDHVASHGVVPYARFLGWRGTLRLEVPAHAEPDPPSAAAVERGSRWKYGLVAYRDDAGNVPLPPSRLSFEARAGSEEVRLADVPATISAFTVDRSTYSLAPAVIDAVIDYDGGGRTTVEVTDAEPADVRVGDRVEMTFRRYYTAGGIHNYFWKARPVRPRRGY